MIICARITHNIFPTTVKKQCFHAIIFLDFFIKNVFKPFVQTFYITLFKTPIGDEVVLLFGKVCVLLLGPLKYTITLYGIVVLGTNE